MELLPTTLTCSAKKMNSFRRIFITAFKILGAIVVLLLFVYLLGPAPKTPVYETQMPEIPPLNRVEKYVSGKEEKLAIKPDNEADYLYFFNPG